jgi:hypothetical protein
MTILDLDWLLEDGAGLEWDEDGVRRFAVS